jgi:hypothetical protein
MAGWNYMVRLYRPYRNPERQVEVPRGTAGVERAVYDPEQAAFDGFWKPGDFEEMKQ